MRFDRIQTRGNREWRSACIVSILAALVLLTGCNQDPLSTDSMASPAQTSEPTTGGTALPQPASANIALSWTPPQENTDGSALTDLAGYHILYGNADGQLTNMINISTPGVTAYTVDNLSSGDWYFSIRAYNSAGVESAPSVSVSTTI